MRAFLPFILIILALVIFFVPIRGLLSDVGPLSAERAELISALDNARAIQAAREDLLAKYNNLSPEDTSKLNKLLPDTVDNVRLIIDINSIAERHGMVLKNIDVSSAPAAAATSPNLELYDSLILRFSVHGNYNELIAFLDSLGKSLRITDVNDLTFSVSPTGEQDYEIDLKTYWLKQ